LLGAESIVGQRQVHEFENQEKPIAVSLSRSRSQIDEPQRDSVWFPALINGLTARYRVAANSLISYMKFSDR
jgi:hypothetical protein